MRLQRLSRGSIDAPHSEALHSAEHIMRNAAVSVSLSTFVIDASTIRVVVLVTRSRAWAFSLAVAAIGP